MAEANFGRVTERQKEALRLAAKGMTAHQVADEMAITYITVNGLWLRARRALNVGSTREAARLLTAFEAGSTVNEQQRLGAEPNNKNLFLKVSELELSVRTINALNSESIKFVGDLVRKNESELLRLPAFGRKSLNETKEILTSLGLKLSLDLPNWPPADIDQVVERLSIAEKIRKISQSKLGTTFRLGAEKLEITTNDDENDQAAATEPLTQQLHEESKRKLALFAEAAKTLNNQYGWSGIDASNRRFMDLLDRATEQIPEVIGLVYSAALELGSFLELDNQLRSGEISFADCLRPEVRRPLEDLVKTVAPWVRRFPSAREIDSETGEFLSQITLVAHAREATTSALQNELIAEEVAQVVRGLLEGVERQGAVSNKASTRGVLSARNMIVAAATAITSVWLGAVGSELAPQSVLAQRAADFLASAETPIVQLFKELPSDIQLALNMLIRQMDSLPVILPPQPPNGKRNKGGKSEKG